MIRRLTFLILFGILTTGLLITFFMYRDAVFRPSPDERDIRLYMISSLSKIFRTEGGRLELASLQLNEHFVRDQPNISRLGLTIPGTYSLTGIRFNVTYTFVITLREEWDITVQDSTLRIIAPALLPLLPPSIHFDTIERVSAQGWMRWDKDEEFSRLEKRIAEELERKALLLAHDDRILKASRQTVIEFIDDWFLNDKEAQDIKRGIRTLELTFRHEIQSPEAK